MTKEKAITLLRRYRRSEYLDRFNLSIFLERDPEFLRCIYGRHLIDELIRMIRESSYDPIDVVWQLYSDLDTVLAESDDDHFITHNYAARMEHECGMIMRYLKRADKEKNEP